MNTFRPNDAEVRFAQDAAKVCEAHMFFVHGCKDAAGTRFFNTTQELARTHSAAAFALSAYIAARPPA